MMSVDIYSKSVPKSNWSARAQNSMPMAMRRRFLRVPFLRVREADGVAHDILLTREEDLPAPERHARERDEDDPSRAHEYDEDEVQREEAADVECVAEHAHARDPPDCVHVRRR
jgi:hypothetical protein